MSSSAVQWLVQWNPAQTPFSNLAPNLGLAALPVYNGFALNEPLQTVYVHPDQRNNDAAAEEQEIFDNSFWNHNAANIHNEDHGAFYGGIHEKHKFSVGGGQVSTMALWLTVLGMAHSQVVPADNDSPPFTTLYKWKQIDFEFQSLKHRRYALATDKFIPENVLPLGIEVWGPRIFVTLPSWRRGVPATLATVSKSRGITSPLLKPYPNWDFHRAFSPKNNCDGLTSVFRISADRCGRLWVLDSGQIDSQTKPKQLCPPSIALFDLQTDKLIGRYVIPNEYVLQDSLFSNLVVDSRRSDCADLHVYIADTWRFGLIVFRHSDASFWRYSHHLFFPDPIASNFTLHGLNFRWTDGIFGLALSPLNGENDERFLYFHPMSSFMEFFVPTSVLRDRGVNDTSYEFNVLGESRGPSGQSSASAVDARGVMFYGLVTKDMIGCWDTAKPYKKSTLGMVARNTETLIFPNDVKVDHEVKQSVWVITNRLPMFQAGVLDSSDYNFRIMFADTNEAVRGTICDPDTQLEGPTTHYRQP